jgi:hypothetical protein
MEAMMTMRILSAFLLLAGCAAQPGPERSAAADAAAAFTGRTAGPDLGCVSTHELRGSRPLAGGAGILFEGRGGPVYLNRPAGGCPGLSEDLALSSSTQAGRLCAGDVVQAFDRASGISHASCTLGPFTPYRPGG